MSRKTKSLEPYRQGSSMSETLLDVGYSIVDLMESRQRRSNRGYTIAMIALTALGFLGGIMVKSHTSDEQPTPTYRSRAIAEPTPSEPARRPATQEPEPLDDEKRRDSPLTTASPQLRPIVEESKEYNHTREQIAPRTYTPKQIPSVGNPEGRYGARKRFTPPVARPNLPPVVEEPMADYIPDTAEERPKSVATRPRRVNVGRKHIGVDNIAGQRLFARRP